MPWLKRLVKTLIAILGVYLGLALVVRLLRRLFPFPVPPVMGPLLGSPLRELSQPRRNILEHSGLRPGMRALELGAGPGFFAVEAARLLGPDGRLSAVDVQPQLIAQATERVRHEGLDNVDLTVANAADLPFPDATFDLAYMVAVLGALPDKGRALRELRRVLKPDGRLAITEAMADPDYMLMVEVVGWAQSVGFELVEQHGNALLYTLTFRSLYRQ